MKIGISLLMLCTWLLQVSTAFGQALNRDQLNKLVRKIPQAERYAFSQQLLGGVALTLNLERPEDLEPINQVADRWTTWYCRSTLRPESDEEWVDFVFLTNTLSLKRRDFPLVVDSREQPRLTAFVLPVSVAEASQIESGYSRWIENNGNREARNTIQASIARLSEGHPWPDLNVELKQRTEQLFANPTPRNWNRLMYVGGHSHWNPMVVTSLSQRFQLELGTQRILASIGFESDAAQFQAKEVGRTYLRAQIANTPSTWQNIVTIITGMLAEKRLQTLVTFVTVDSKKMTANATIAYHPIGNNQADRTQQPTLKMNSGEYLMWSERGGAATSDSLKHLVFSETYTAKIVEKDNAVP